MNKKAISILIISAIIGVICLSLAIGWPYIMNAEFRQNLVLSPNSTSYKMWVKTPLPMFLDIYLFNVTNAKEFELNPTKVKPVVEEIGPFIYREIHERVNITWNNDGTVSYNQTRKWNFVEENSVPLNTSITNLNVIALGAAHATRYSSKYLEGLLNGLMLIEKTSVFITKPAEEWLFKGMDLSLLDFLNKEWVKKLLPMPIPYDKFGFFYKRNMSAAYDGRFEVLTGANKMEEIGNVVRWRNKTKSGYYSGQCSMLDGSAGEIFPPNNEENFTLFISDICSSLTLKYSDTIMLGTLPGRRYVGDETMLDNGQKLPSRKCFCDGGCVPSGARNVSSCRQGAPVFVSFPHFYLADQSYFNSVVGLKPNKSLHEFRLTLESETGIPLDVRAQLQINMNLQPYPKYSLYKNMPNIFLPVLWFNQRAQISYSLESQTLMLLGLAHLSPYLYGLGCSCLLFTITLALIARVKNGEVVEEEPLINQEDTEENE